MTDENAATHGNGLQLPGPFGSTLFTHLATLTIAGVTVIAWLKGNLLLTPVCVFGGATLLAFLSSYYGDKGLHWQWVLNVLILSGFWWAVQANPTISGPRIGNCPDASLATRACVVHANGTESYPFSLESGRYLPRGTRLQFVGKNRGLFTAYRQGTTWWISVKPSAVRALLREHHSRETITVTAKYHLSSPG